MAGLWQVIVFVSCWALLGFWFSARMWRIVRLIIALRIDVNMLRGELRGARGVYVNDDGDLIGSYGQNIVQNEEELTQAIRDEVARRRKSAHPKGEE